jgi:hypothetical protein
MLLSLFRSSPSTAPNMGIDLFKNTHSPYGRPVMSTFLPLFTHRRFHPCRFPTYFRSYFLLFAIARSSAHVWLWNSVLGATELKGTGRSDFTPHAHCRATWCRFNCILSFRKHNAWSKAVPNHFTSARTQLSCFHWSGSVLLRQLNCSQTLNLQCRLRGSQFVIASVHIHNNILFERTDD